MMFLGEYTHSIDDKGRLTIPAKFRQELESGLFVTAGFDQCLWLFSRDGWDKFSEKLSQLPMSQVQARNASRYFFSQAMEAIPDRQGRILLPDNLRGSANLSDS